MQTQAWTNRRVELFRRYNLPSILSQTHSDFLYVILLDPALRHLTDPVLPAPDPRVIYCYDDAPVLEMLRQYDELVMALIDNDDMYARTAGAVMMGCKSEWMYFRKGYAMEERTGRVWNYNTLGTGPFWARRIDPKTLAQFDRDKRHPTHVAVLNYKPKELAAGQFCVLLHNANTSSTVQMRHVIKKPVNANTFRRQFAVRWSRSR